MIHPYYLVYVNITYLLHIIIIHILYNISIIILLFIYIINHVTCFVTSDKQITIYMVIARFVIVVCVGCNEMVLLLVL